MADKTNNKPLGKQYQRKTNQNQQKAPLNNLNYEQEAARELTNVNNANKKLNNNKYQQEAANEFLETNKEAGVPTGYYASDIDQETATEYDVDKIIKSDKKNKKNS